MAVPALAVAAGQAAVKYAPQVYDGAKALLASATGGKLKDITPSAITAYVGNSPSRLSVVGSGLVKAGMNVEDIFPADIVGTNKDLQAMRASAAALADRMRAQFDAGADKSVPVQSPTDAVSDLIRIKRVKAVLQVYGSAENYFLCHPNGGVPADDFAFYKAMRRAI